MSAHVATGPAGQVHGRPLEVLGCSPPPGRDPRRDARQPVLVLEQGLVHVRVDVPRRNGVDRDAPIGPLVRHALCQLPNGALASRVGGHVEPTLEGEQRGKVDDAAPAAGDGAGLELEHVGADVAAQGEDGVEVDLHDLGEDIVGKGLAGVAALDAGAGDEDADLVAVGEDLGHEGGHLLWGGELCRVDPRPPAQLLDGFLGGRVGCVALRGFRKVSFAAIDQKAVYS